MEDNSGLQVKTLSIKSGKNKTLRKQQDNNFWQALCKTKYLLRFKIEKYYTVFDINKIKIVCKFKKRPDILFHFIHFWNY